MTDKTLLYLYDLPKENITSVSIAKVFKDVAGCENIDIPQIRRDPNKPFYTAIVKVSNDSNQDFRQIAKKLKYFQIGEKPCRALPFDKDLLGSNRNQTSKQNIFVKHLDKSLKSKDLEEKFCVIGEVKSAKVSINPDYSSRGYGFVCFQNPEDVEKAIAQSKQLGVEVLPYNPRDRREIKKAYNNIYVKNFPDNWDEGKLRQEFSKYGNISSLVLLKKKQEDGSESPFAFICYLDPNDKEYGPKCAMKAVNDLHDKEIDGKKLYVREALKKADREIEKKKDQLRFKNSKKRCNLYVKNFPPNTTEQQLRDYFGKYGEIESVKIFSKENEAVYAFVCFKNPDNATQAKAQLNSQTFNGRILYINHYEIKEVRQIQQEDLRDKANFQDYKKSNQGNLNLEIFNKPEVFSLIQQLFMYMQRQHSQNRQNQRFQGQRQPRGPHQQPGAMPKPGQMTGQMPQQMPPNMPPQMQQPPLQQTAGMMQQPMRGQPQLIPGQLPQQVPMGIPPQIPMMMQQQQVPQNVPPMFLEYNARGFQLVPAVVPQNPNYKSQVGEFIFEYVERIAGDEQAPKITGMLIDLPLEEIKGYLVDYGKLQNKISEAKNLLSGF